MYFTVVFTLALFIKGIHTQTTVEEYLSSCKSHSKILRPVEDDNKAVDINITMMIERIDSLTSGGLTIEAGLIQSWKDLRFCHGSTLPVQRLSLPKSTVWTPDLTSYERPFTKWEYEPKILYLKNQDVLYSPATSLWTDKCSVIEETGITECSIRIGTWTYDKTELNLQSDGILFSEYHEHPHFKIVNSSAIRYDQHDECCAESFPYIKYTFFIRKI